MSKNRTPSALYNSGKERLDRDTYYTEAWLTEIALRHLKVKGKTVLEPAAGRGDMVRVLRDAGAKVVAADINTSAWKKNIGGESKPIKHDFLGEKLKIAGGWDFIITNPPYFKHEGVSMAERFARRALSPEYNATAVALLCRGTFNTGKKRRDLWTPLNSYAYEIVITERPRWDWCWPEEMKGDSTPFHAYSWFVWDRRWKGPHTTFFEAR